MANEQTLVRLGPSVKRFRSEQIVSTPWEFIRAVEKKFGPIAVDLAATAENAKARKFISPTIDTFTQNWTDWLNGGLGWLNPEFDPMVGYTELLAHINGAAHFGAWCALVQVASKCNPRGTLVRQGDRDAKPHDPRSLSRQTRLSESVFSEAIPRLVEIGWLEEVGAVPEADRGAQPDLLTYTENDSSAEFDTDSQSGANRPETAAPIRIEQNRTEQKRTEEKQSTSRSARERTPTRNPRTLVPKDFQPDEATIAFATATFPNIDLEGARSEFVDYWLGEGELKSDWNATFRNRLRFLDSRGMMRKKQERLVPNNERTTHSTNHQQTGSGQVLRFKSVL